MAKQEKTRLEKAPRVTVESCTRSLKFEMILTRLEKRKRRYEIEGYLVNAETLLRMTQQIDDTYFIESLNLTGGKLIHYSEIMSENYLCITIGKLRVM